jgi:hypothetical protein
MSQYRDDRGASRLRIEALEARLAEREAELDRRGAQLAARDEEILRLQRELELAGGLGPRHMRSVNAAWASRIVGAAAGLTLAAAGAGVILVRSSATVGPLPVVELAEGDPEAPLLHADPLVSGAIDWSTPPEVEPPTPRDQLPAVSPQHIEIRRRVEPRVWGGRASKDEIRMLRALCAYQGDEACRDRARAELERARGMDP